MRSKTPAGTRWLWWATAVLLLAALLRIVALADVPPGLSQDEVLNADVATFIRQGTHAIFFREGYGHEPLYHYWSVPFQVLLGDNVLSMRLPAIALGLLIVALILSWARRSFGPVAAIAAGTFMAVSWWPIIFSRVGLRPIMEPFFLLLFAWSWPRRPWLAGLFLGLSLYTYTGARVIFLWPALLTFYWLIFRKRIAVAQVTVFGRSLPQPLFAAGVVLLVALVVYLPLALTLQADPSLQQRVQQLEGPLAALREGDMRPILQTSLATLGVFSFTGDPRWTYMIPGQPLFDPITAVFFYGGLLLAVLHFNKPAYAFALFWLVVGLLPSAITPQAPSTIRMIGALPAVYVMPALAVSWLWEKRSVGSALLRYGIPLLVAVLFILNLGRTLANFVRWPQAIETRMKYQSVLMDIAGFLREHPEGQAVFADGFYRPITVDTLRRNLGYESQGRWVQTGEDVAGALVLPAQGDGKLYVPEFAAPDGDLMAMVGVGEPLFRSEQRPSFAVYDLPLEHHVNELEEAAAFADIISLVGYEITTPQDGQAIQMVTVWQVNGELPADLAIFVHWLDGEEQLISQHDGLDAAPETLQPGDLIIQRHVLPWTAPLPIPAGSLRLGLYLRDSGNRLETFDGAGNGFDHLLIPLQDENGGE